MKSRRKLWFRLATHGRWSVWLVIGPLMVDGVSCLGAVNRGSRQIMLSVNQSWNELHKTFVHEAFHAACGDSQRGGDSIAEQRGVALDASEEYYARLSERGLTALLRPLGFALPDLPEGICLNPPPGQK